MFALRPVDDPPAVTDPPPTTTTVAPTTTSATPDTTIDAAPPTTSSTTAAPSVTVPPQTFAATVTWDGEACLLDAPTEIRPRDAVEFTFVNNSTDVVDFWVSYLTSGSTPADLAALNGPIDVTAPGSQAPFVILVDSAPGSSGFGTLPVGETAAKTIELKVERVHVVTCFGGPQPPAAETQLAVSTPTGIRVDADAVVSPVAASYDASLVWDGSTCAFEGPSEALPGDTLNITYANESDDVASFVLSYLISSAAIEDLDAYDGDFDTTTNESRPPFVVPVDSFPAGSGLLEAGQIGSQEVVMKQARQHVITCFGGRPAPAAETQFVKSADVGVVVNE